LRADVAEKIDPGEINALDEGKVAGLLQRPKLV
jgi:hypothetical protein